MKILESIKIPFKKKKNLSKAERSLRQKNRLINFSFGLYVVFIFSNIFHTIVSKTWLFFGIQIFFLLFSSIMYFFFLKKAIKNEKEMLKTQTQFANETYDLIPDLDMRKLSLSAKATFVEHITSQREDQFTQCVEGLLEHYEKTKHLSLKET